MMHRRDAGPACERRPRSRALVLGLAGVIAAGVLAACHSSTAPTAHFAGGPSGSGAAGATEPATPQSIGIDPAAVVAAALPTELTAFIKGRGGNAGLAVVDRTTGATVAVNANRIFQTASIVKFDILATRLYQHQRNKTAMTSNEKSLAFRMITQSDNNAASALFSMDGSQGGLTAANEVFGLKTTQVGSSWGRTRTTPADQIRLLTSVMDPNGPITAANRSYLLSLMSKVEPDQRWGVPAAADSTATGVYNKNGWDTMSSYGGLWGDNSIGRIVEPGHDWLVAVMSNYNRTDSAGHALDGKIATLAVGGLRLHAELATNR